MIWRNNTCKQYKDTKPLFPQLTEMAGLHSGHLGFLCGNPVFHSDLSYIKNLSYFFQYSNSQHEWTDGQRVFPTTHSLYDGEQSLVCVLYCLYLIYLLKSTNFPFFVAFFCLHWTNVQFCHLFTHLLLFHLICESDLKGSVWLKTSPLWHDNNSSFSFIFVYHPLHLAADLPPSVSKLCGLFSFL